MEVNELSKNAMGGTELMLKSLHDKIRPDLLNECQIIPSRVRELKDDKVRIFWAHDLPGDPESEVLKHDGHDKFHKLVFVSNWQQQAYINTYRLPWSKCTVIQNAIEPIEHHEKPNNGTIRLIYFSTPHRGLNILIPVFEKLAGEYDNIELDVYSSFKLYGWEERDKEFEALFDRCKKHPKINYHGSVDNLVIREALKKAHILAYPSIWPETSCLVLMESMSAGLVCVHPNYAALPETAANWTYMYNWHEDINKHAGNFYYALKEAINNVNEEGLKSRIASQSSYANIFYSWKTRIPQWEALIDSLKNLPRVIPKTEGPMFHYKVG